MLDGNGRWQRVMSQPHPSLRCADRYSYSMLMGFRCDAVRVVDSSSSATAAGSFLKEFRPELSSCNSDADCYLPGTLAHCLYSVAVAYRSTAANTADLCELSAVEKLLELERGAQSARSAYSLVT